jgi:transcriptional regulator of acetoin/glycerol metabolism
VLERNRTLLVNAQPVMEHVHDQIRDSGYVVILADAAGMLLQCVGDPDFLDTANKVSLMPGASWDESQRGTNAVGSALVEERAMEIFGAEHFLDRNGFLVCSAAPVRDSHGNLAGVLDISGDYRSYHRHTLGLVKLSARMIETRLFESEQASQILLHFHARQENLGSLSDGVLAVTIDGLITAVNHAGLEMLGLRRQDVVGRDFSILFETSLATMVDQQRSRPLGSFPINTRERKAFFARLRGDLPSSMGKNRVFVSAPPTTPRVEPPQQNMRSVPLSSPTFDSLCTGDQRLQAAVDRARKVVGRDIPILIQGESGAGKEMFAKAFHSSGPRSHGPFVALNCAAIPETLIESELFGYMGGAFTGARKEGAPGKIQLADGGTLFLDEIGDMPLSLQARLLRVLQERCVIPLGGTRPVHVDISLVCATHRNLKEEVKEGRFRADLYYRLNGLSMTIPPLRERTDLSDLVLRLVASETQGSDRHITVAAEVMEVFQRYSWPGNIRQLNNVLKVAIALLDDDEDVINVSHLPEDIHEVAEFFESPVVLEHKITAEAHPFAGDGKLEDMERQAILRVLEAEGNNISAAARKLGISRNTLYRKIGRM